MYLQEIHFMVIYNQSTGGGVIVEKMRRGRPKSDQPTRNKVITVRMSEEELKKLQDLCYEKRIAYIDVLLKGLEFWSRK